MRKVVVILSLLIYQVSVIAQSNIVFKHLTTANGLSYLGAKNLCTDWQGNLWIATGNGLNMFNGKTTERYFVSEYPQLQNNNFKHVTCDSSNRIWALTEDGNVTMLDAKRQLHRVGLYEKNEFVKTRWILNSQKGSIILFTEKGHYALNTHISLSSRDSLTRDHFNLLTIKGYDTLMSKRFRQVFYYDDDHYLLVMDDVFFKINYRTKEVEKKYAVPNCTALIKWEQNSLLAHNQSTNEVEIIDLDDGMVTYPFRDLVDQNGKKISAVFNFAEKINGQKYVLSSQGDGIFIYDHATRTITNYRHSYANPASLGANLARNLVIGQKGWVFVLCIPHGISYFNVADIISNQVVFSDNKGNGYDGVIFGIATVDNIRYYIGISTGMLEWNRKTNTTTFIDFIDKDGYSVFRQRESVSIVFDDKERIWANTIDNGIIVMNKNRQLLRHIRYEENDPGSLKIRSVRGIYKGPDGYMWLCGKNGISRINPDNYKVDNLENTPLAFFDTSNIFPLLFSNKEDLWIAASIKGLYHYNLVTKKMEENEVYKNYKADGIWDIKADSYGNIYVGNQAGVRILFTNGTTKTITQKDGLLINRGEGLLQDDHNRMWIGNDIGLGCYDPADSSLKVFDVRYGLSIYGFRVASYFKMPNGEFFFGTPKGLQYFHPDSLYDKRINLHVSVTKIETGQFVSTMTESSEFKLAAEDNQVTFYFGTADYSQHLRTYYEYKLFDLDKDWIKATDQNSVRYNSLPPGKYVFKVRISNDNKNWQESDNEVTIIVAAPFYQTWWFKAAGILLGLFLIWYVVRYYQKKQAKQREQLESELVINYFASQINSHRKTDELLWDVAKNCISQLNFEDCVIYLKHEEKNVLVQKAAYGPKMQRDLSIYHPIEIPVGRGIVGSVAASGVAELIANTDLDKRYIADDARRLSEIAVPLIIDGKVIGVIDSEHSRRNFFSQKHLNILNTIAVLCANQLQRAKAEQEKQQAKIELLENKQKAVESRLQSLRLQMNPHFLFNALNSVQQMILANEEMVATKYLSRFSKLLRAILVYSDKETISLKEELEILHLYVELESIRFKGSFTYEITCDEEIDTDEIKIPTLLVQPFVENAIWHGLMHKEGERKLRVEFTEANDIIVCVIEDNGIGRSKAAERKMAAGQQKHASRGIEVSKERLKALHVDGVEGKITILDLVDKDGAPAGTQVVIIFPIKTS